MKHIKTLSKTTLKNTMAKGGCGECQTSCTVGNQSCENNKQSGKFSLMLLPIGSGSFSAAYRSV